MKIKGIETVSLVDFPGNISSVLFCGGCNFDCDYCFNRSLVENIDTNQSISFEDCFSILESRRDFIDGVVVSGGEPTIQDGIIDLLEELGKRRFKVKIDTNGYNPKVLKEIIDKRLVKYIAMDIKAPLDNYYEVAGKKIDTEKVKQSIGIIKDSSIKYEFRSTIWKDCPIERNPTGLKEILKDASRYYLQNYQDVYEKGVYRPMTKAGVGRLLIELNFIKKIELRGDWK